MLLNSILRSFLQHSRTALRVVVQILQHTYEQFRYCTHILQANSTMHKRIYADSLSCNTLNFKN